MPKAAYGKENAEYVLCACLQSQITEFAWKLILGGLGRGQQRWQKVEWMWIFKMQILLMLLLQFLPVSLAWLEDWIDILRFSLWPRAFPHFYSWRKINTPSWSPGNIDHADCSASALHRFLTAGASLMDSSLRGQERAKRNVAWKADAGIPGLTAKSIRGIRRHFLHD